MPVIGLAHVQHMSNTGERTDQPLQAQALILCCHNVRYGLDCPASRGPWFVLNGLGLCSTAPVQGALHTSKRACERARARAPGGVG